jgi:SAM-dependent methyltransferase
VDVGAGPGVAACELARLFPTADVIAFDSSPAMLARAQARSDTHGGGGRVRTVLGELPHGLRDSGLFDMIWASMSLHHVGDEVGALTALRESLVPGGTIAIVEMADPMRVLPADLGMGRPGLGDRMQARHKEWFGRMRNSLPGAVASRDLADMVSDAGLAVLDDRVDRLRFDPPLTDNARTVATGMLERARSQLDASLDADDRSVLDALLDPNNPLSFAQRTDVFIDASHRIILAQAVTRP